MNESLDRAAKSKLASAKGFANEMRLVAALLERGFNASKVDLPHSTYDIAVELSASDIVRVQVKTLSDSMSISFTGGSRGGVDRAYKSGVKTYTQSTETSDIVVGVRSQKTNGDERIDFYFVPTILVEELGQQSLSARQIPNAKNNWDILKNCKDASFVLTEFSKLLSARE